MMGSGSDTEACLRNLLEIEDNSLEVYREALRGVRDSGLIALIHRHMRDEERHKTLVMEALKLVRG